MFLSILTLERLNTNFRQGSAQHVPRKTTHLLSQCTSNMLCSESLHLYTAGCLSAERFVLQRSARSKVNETQGVHSEILNKSNPKIISQSTSALIFLQDCPDLNSTQLHYIHQHNLCWPSYPQNNKIREVILHTKDVSGFLLQR